MRILLIAVSTLLLWSCGGNKTSDAKADAPESNAKEVNIYMHRHYDTDKALLKAFEEKTGIKVNVVKAKADELIEKMKIEGEHSPADILITSDAARLVRAKELNLLQTVSDIGITEAMMPYLKDEENTWFGITKRARVIVYDKDKYQADDIPDYESLAADKWNGKLLIRSSSNVYNQSLMASLIANLGEEKSKEWATKVVANLARAPKGNDRDQVKAIAAGQGEVAVVNTYYIGKLLNGSSEEEKNAGNKVGIIFPNQKDRGTHINVSGMGMAKYAPNKANAIELMKYLLSAEVQKAFAEANYEYPVVAGVEPSELLKSWGSFKEDTLSLNQLGVLNQKAVMLFDQVAWK